MMLLIFRKGLMDDSKRKKIGCSYFTTSSITFATVGGWSNMLA